MTPTATRNAGFASKLSWFRNVFITHDRARLVAICLGLFLVTLWTFWPALRGEFIGYDDSLFVTENPQVQRGLSWSNAVWSLHQVVAANWHPLTLLSHMLDCQLHGMEPWGHHLTNVLLHAATSVLVFLTFRRMTNAGACSAMLAALFALHPLRVESVAWISERKDVLSVFFWMLTLLAYAHYAAAARGREPGARTLYVLTLVFFIFGLMSKPMLVTLPFVLLLLDYWPLNRFQTANACARPRAIIFLIKEKLPFFTLSAIGSVMTYLLQKHQGAVATGIPPDARIANALVSYARYLGKTFWPVNLSVFYPHPHHWPMWQVVLATALLLGITAIAIRLAQSRPYATVGWFWFCGTLVPVIGLVQVGSQAMADRYSYVPSIGLFVILVWGARDFVSGGRGRKLATAVVSVLALLLCIGTTRRQIGCWKDEETLWLHALDVTSRNDLANANLGVVYFNLGVTQAERGAFENAILNYKKAIQLDPKKDDAHRSLAYALFRTGRFHEAIREYELTLQINPNDAEAHNNLCNIFGRRGRRAEAIHHGNEALRLKSGYREAHFNLGSILASEGRYGEAIVHFQEAIRLDPRREDARQKLAQARAAEQRLEEATAPLQQILRSNPDDASARENLGRLLLDAGRIGDAIEQFTEAARLKPDSAELHYTLGAALARNDDLAKAASEFRKALAIKPGLAQAHYALGILCQQQQQTREALKHWRDAARLAPTWPDPLNNLAWALATSPQPELRDGSEAVTLAARAVELSATNNVRILGTLAAAHAEAGRFADAVSTAREALSLATIQKESDLAAELHERLALYSSNRPYRQDSGKE